MRYVVIMVLLLTAYYEFTFSKALWRRKNYLGAVGVIVIALLSVAVPMVVIFRD